MFYLNTKEFVTQEKKKWYPANNHSICKTHFNNLINMNGSFFFNLTGAKAVLETLNLVGGGCQVGDGMSQTQDGTQQCRDIVVPVYWQNQVWNQTQTCWINFHDDKLI